MPFVELVPVPQDPQSVQDIIGYLNQNFRRVSDTLGRSAGLSDNKDIEITDSARGIILTAPNSNRYRITVSNTGVLTTTLV